MKTSSAKNKGRRLQKLIAEDLIAVHDSITPDDVVSRAMGSQGSDIMLSSVARRVLGSWDIECKNQESFSNVYKAFNQMRDRQVAADPKKSLLVIKKNGELPLAILNWNFFLQLLTDNIYLRERPSA